MFDRKDLEELEKIKWNDILVVSLFLNVSPQERKNRLIFRNLKI
jgi:hypothetical protein